MSGGHDNYSLERLADLQKRNLEFSEKFGREMPAVAGIPILVGLSYEVVQVLNAMTLQKINSKELKNEK